MSAGSIALIIIGILVICSAVFMIWLIMQARKYKRKILTYQWQTDAEIYQKIWKDNSLEESLGIKVFFRVLQINLVCSFLDVIDLAEADNNGRHISMSHATNYKYRLKPEKTN